jgi:hypothetical protein
LCLGAGPDQLIEDGLGDAQARRLGRPVPSGGRTRQSLTQTAPQIDYNDEDAFKKALLAARQGGG